ncbi:hypothetical protein [Labrys neptuniae]
MGFALTDGLRTRLRKAIVKSFSRKLFTEFAEEKLGVDDFISAVGDGAFGYQLHQFLIDYEAAEFIRLANALKESRPRDAEIQSVCDEVLAATVAYSVRKRDPNSFLLTGNRLFLNRDSLRKRMDSFTNGTSLERLLIVHGERSSGKTYSKLLIGEYVNDIKRIQADLPGIATGEFEAHHIALTIANRVWMDTNFIRFDDFNQPARDAKWLGDRLVQGLGELKAPTLIVVDQFELAPLSNGAKELIMRLISSIEFGECPNLWLVFIGLDISQFEQYDGVILPDKACPPDAKDIAKFLRISAAAMGIALDETVATDEATRLADMLKTGRTDKVWREFSGELKLAVTKIRGGAQDG